MRGKKMAIEEDESDFGGNRGDNDATTDQEPVIHRHLWKMGNINWRGRLGTVDLVIKAVFQWNCAL